MYFQILMHYDILTKTIVPIFFAIDKAIYTLLSWIMTGFFELAKAPNTIFGGDAIFEAMIKKMYVLIGIFALFKLAFNLINSVISPDKLTDKENGFGKLIQRTIVALVLVLMLPYIFNTALTMQDHILSAIPAVILGTGGIDGDTYGQAVAATTLKSFVNPNTKTCSGQDPNEYYMSSPDLDALENKVTEKCSSNSAAFAYDYTMFVSTITGFILIVIMILISIDVAVRSFKLVVLEMIAPLPIISYIDPKSSKGGMFDSWLKLTIKTYTSIFLQMASVYLVLALLSLTVKNINLGGYSFPLNVWLTIFLVIGAFLFLFEATKFINKALGIKESEKGAASKILGLGAAAAGGAALGAAGGLIAGGGLAGAGAAALEGLNSGIHGGKVTAGFGKGLDIGTRIKSGGADTKYKNFLMKGQQNLMQRQAAKELFGDPNADMDRILEDYKNIRNADSAAYDAARTQYESGKSFEYQGKEYSGEELYQLIYNKDGLRMKAQKSEGKFNDIKNYMASFGVDAAKRKSIDEARDANKYFAKDHSTMPMINVSSNNSQTSNPISNDLQPSAPISNGSQPSQSSRVVQERIDRMVGVHDVPTREEHNSLNDEYQRFWNDQAVSSMLDANEREIDSRNNQG